MAKTHSTRRPAGTRASTRKPSQAHPLRRPPKVKLPGSPAENRRTAVLADQKFEAIALSPGPMSAEACRNRDIVVRMCIAFLGKSSEELHRNTTDPFAIEALLEVMEKSKTVADWMRTTAGFLDTAHLRMTCIIAKAFTVHPEWASLKSAGEARS